MAAQPSATAFPAVPGVPSEVAKLTPDARRAIDELCRKHARLRATLDAARVHDGGGHPDRDAARPRQDDSSEPIGAHSRDVAAENSTAQLRRSRPGGNGEPQLAERDKKPETEERTIVQPQSRLATESSKPNGPQGAAAMESPSATSVDATWHAADVSLEEEAGLPVATVDEGGIGRCQKRLGRRAPRGHPGCVGRQTDQRGDSFWAAPRQLPRRRAAPRYHAFSAQEADPPRRR